MASQDKLVKALEALRLSITLNAQNIDLTVKKKDKITNISIIADTICNTNIRVIPNFPNLLSVTIEVFLQLCDDPESDVRMIADECLNRIIRAMSDSHIAKIQVELHKEIKKNGPARTLRAALSRFAQLCHLIKPQKGKPYIQILVPCIVKIATREEESVLETLDQSLGKIMTALGCFASDNEIKTLLRTFLLNVSHISAVVRRTAANSMITICMNCRKPQVFITFVLNTILDLIIPIRDDVSVSLLLGIFSCLRCFLPHTNVECCNEEMQGSFGVRKDNQNRTNQSIGDRFIQIYELCLYYSVHNDHNVINAALETLHTLLDNPGENLLEILLSSKGISRSRITPLDGQINLKIRSLSEMSVAVSEIQPEENFLLSNVTDKLSAPDVENWIEMSKLAHSDLKDVIPTQSFDRLSLNNYYEDDTKPEDTEADHENRTSTNLDEYNNLFIRNINDNESDISNSTNRESFDIAHDFKIESTQTRKSSSGDVIDERASFKSTDDFDGDKSPCPFKDINIGEFTDEAIPLNYCARHLIKSLLLTGYPKQLIPDSMVRVSVKSLALTCLSKIVQLYPDVLTLYLDKSFCAKTTKSNINEQPISDIFLYANHHDPQIRGIVRILVASMLKSILFNNNANYLQWLEKMAVHNLEINTFKLDFMIDILNKGLEDESSTCNKQSLLALKICLADLLESENSKSVIPILNSLPVVVKNPYWLVKVQLVEVLQELPYITIFYVTGNSEFQDKVLHNVFYYLLANDDLRVRNSAAKSIVRIIPHLFYQKDHPHNLPITAKTIEYRLKYMNKLLDFNIETNMTQKYFLSTMPEPFSALNNNHNSNYMLNKIDFFEKSLSRIINYLELQLLESESKYLTYGCCEALSILSNEYLTTIYNRAWNCLGYVKKNTNLKSATFQRTNSQYIDTSLLTNTTAASGADTTNSCSSGLLNICVALMTTSTLSEDISCQQWLLTLAGNIFSGLSIQIFKSVDTLNLDSNQGRKNWDIYTDSTFGLIVEQLLTHVIRMLNIFTHVLDENTPVLPTAKTALPSLPNAPTLSSPMKRKSKVETIEKNKLISPAKILTGAATTTIDKDDLKSEKKSETNSKINTMGYFVNNPHYMKMYEILKTAYGNYKLTLDESASEKFLKLLQIVLNTLSQILEMCTIQECGRIAEELLQYLQSCVNFEPTASIQCVQQLLKCLFGTNLCSQLEQVNLLHTQKKRHFNNALGSHSDINSFYSAAFQYAYTKFTNCLNTIAIHKKLDKDDCSTMLGGFMRRKSERKSSLTFKSLARCADKASLASYIRLFEPMVIKSLKQYTVTSDVNLQCRVLQLLSQLVQLRVNYCLLDSDQIFIGFVLKQFEFIEEGQIPNADQLIPKIFNFLVHLSYENQHSKSIIVIPKIINLCDGLMASGQSPVTHCIPALRPVIIDVFLFRGNSNNTTTELKELETTRDVLFSMLLRLVEYHDVLEMLTLVISDSRYHSDNGERWIKWSKLVVDSVVPMLLQRRIRLDSRSAQIALHSLLCELHPNVYKAMDPLLLVLFQDPPYMESPMSAHHRWLGGILAILLTLSSVREEVLLFKINDIRMDIPIRAVYTKLIENYDPLNVTSSAQSIHNIPEEEIFARFMFRVFHIVSEKCLQSLQTNKANINTQYFIEQFSTVLLFCIHMFESGSHCKIAHTAMNLLHNPSTADNQIPIEETNDIFLKLATFVPLLTFHWCYILTLLGYSEQKYWSKILQNPNNNYNNNNKNNKKIDNNKNDNNKIQYCDFDDDNIKQKIQQKVQIKQNFNSINLEIVRIGGIILYSDYICENLTDCENLTWFLVNHIESVIKLSNEFPVAEFVAAIHRNHAASGLFVQAVAARCQQFHQTSFVNKLLKCLENVHPSQSGPLLVFLVPNLFNCKPLALSRLNAGLASRRTELLLTMSIEEVTSQLSKEDLTIIMEILLQRKLAKKHGTFVSLLNKLASKYYDLSPLELDQGRTINPDCIKKIRTDKAWFYSQVKLRCCQNCYLGPESAELLNKLPYDDIISIMSQKDFNKLILKDCISLLTLNLMDDTMELNQETPLLKASVEILMTHVVYFKSFMPKSHQVYNVNGLDISPTETKYTNRLNELFSDTIFWQSFFDITPSVNAYLELIRLHRSIQIPEQHYEDLTKFSVLCLETITYLIKLQNDSSESINIELNYIELALQCTSAVLKQNNLCNILALDTHMTWLCSSINSIYILVNYFLLNNEPLPTLSKYGLLKTFQKSQTQYAANACYQLSILIAWLEKLQKQFKPNIPESIFLLIRSIIVSLARLPLVNSYVLTPPDVWEHMWQVELLGTFNTQVPPLPIEYLQEIEILEQFIFRVTLLGWVNRHQFEETWMCLLSVLSAESSDDNQHHADDLSVIIQANSLAVQAITSLLMQTLLIPIPGHPNVSHYLHVPREKNLNQSSLSIKKLKTVQNKLYWRYKHCFHLSDDGTNVNLENIFERPNLDRVHQSTDQYLYGQLSIEYLWTAANMLQSTEPNSKAVQMLKEKEECAKDSALDIHSCLQFLLDLYSQWTKPQFGTPLRLLNEVVRSMLAISDLFTEKSQFQWMLDVCLELSKTHPPEDEILHQYIVLGVCKAAAVLTPDLEVYEIIKRLIENSLKSGFLPERIACLHGLLYLLQSSVMSNTVIGGMSDEMLLIHPMAIDYIQYYITVNNGTLYQSEDHRQVMWALAFYLLEHVEEQIADTEIVPNVLQVVMLLLSSQNSQLSMTLHNTLLQGLERLIVAKSITGNVVEQVTKLAVDRLKHPNPCFAFPALQLLLACMYTEGEKQINAPENVNGIVQMDPDLLVEGIEKISAIFDRIKKGYPFEAQILCTVLPHVLNDFFPPPEILTKVIGEFLSQQQPHPRLLSNVVFQIFERASAQNQLTLLQDWVVFSLSNFTQCLPIGMATWCLICFFISASTNHWLRALFPHVQSRIGKYEYEDRKMLCVAATDFYRQLTSDVQKKKFVETFETVVDLPGTPFKDLLLSL